MMAGMAICESVDRRRIGCTGGYCPAAHRFAEWIFLRANV